MLTERTNFTFYDFIIIKDSQKKYIPGRS